MPVKKIKIDQQYGQNGQTLGVVFFVSHKITVIVGINCDFNHECKILPIIVWFQSANFWDPNIGVNVTMLL